MESKEQEPFRSISYEEELERAKWFKEDLEKDNGWTTAAKGSGFAFWIKTFHDEEFPIKILLDFDMPFPATVFAKLLDPKNIEARNDWDKSFADLQCLETFPDGGGSVTYMKAVLSGPLTDRSFELFLPSPREVDWYRKKATLHLLNNAWHPLQPVGKDGCVRATNGGDFYVVTPDETYPDAACHVFGLTTNLYNGWIPKTNMEWMMRRVVPRRLSAWRENLIQGYEKYFKN